MSYKMSMGDDGILWVTYIGDMGDEDIEPYLGDFMSFVETATEAEPLHVLSKNRQAGKVSTGLRKKFVGLLGDPRIGKVATVGADRYTRVVGGFILKATGRDNICFFDSEEQALAWLKAES